MTRMFDRLRRTGKRPLAVHLTPDVQVIVADDILAYNDARPDRVWQGSDFPCVALPFQKTFVEASSEQMRREQGIEFEMGVLFSDVTEGRWQSVRRLYPPPDAVHWALELRGYMRYKHTLSYYPGVAMLHLDERGRIVDDLHHLAILTDSHAAPFVTDLATCQKAGWQTKWDFMNSLPVMLMALALINCKNVTLNPHYPQEKQSRAHERKYGDPLTTFHTLFVVPSGRFAREAVHGGGWSLAQHLRRGHFKTFTPEKPLFGRYSGTFWWNPQAVGSAEVGKREKQYAVSADRIDECLDC